MFQVLVVHQYNYGELANPVLASAMTGICGSRLDEVVQRSDSQIIAHVLYEVVRTAGRH
ncbi:hypothetical protein PILCRDRAFT_828695 [Piloderma croceum F 1598]|uniref:Uncharacterized protein n=1 Tax=Piloderma croceum (strain F 1598) TaxID=765440 RepID=A0A0C3AJ33_PILCF|nr:hypothetical protein PILCRDRAFT_828695 [Piloderma croceum F 1598]